MPCRQSGGFTPFADFVQGGFHKCVKEAAVRIEVFDGPPRAAVLESQSEVVHLFVRLEVVSDLREAVLHFVPVVPIKGGRHKPLVQGVEVFHLANLPVKVQGRARLPFVLLLHGHRGVRGTRNGLVREVHFEVCGLHDPQEATFGMTRFALGHLGVHHLAGKGVLDKHHERAFFRLDTGDAFAAKSHVFDGQPKLLAFVKCAFDATMSSHARKGTWRGDQGGAVHLGTSVPSLHAALDSLDVRDCDLQWFGLGLGPSAGRGVDAGHVQRALRQSFGPLEVDRTPG